MENNKFLAKVDEINKGDYAKADLIAFKFDDGAIKFCSEEEEGQCFMVYLVRDYGTGIEGIDICSSYKEARQLVDKLNVWLEEDDFDDYGWDW